MIKVDLKSDNKAANDFLKKIQKEFAEYEYDININNVNDFALVLEEKANCLKCNGLSNCQNCNVGYATEFDGESFVLAQCRFKKEAIAKSKEGNLIKTLFVSKKILEANLEDMHVNTDSRKKIYEHIIKFISDVKLNKFNFGLYIYGDFSTGKTFILGCIANELARNKIESLVIYFPDLVVELKNAIGTPRFEELINYLKSVDVLMLDDLGSENMTPWLRDDILGPVLNYRLMEEKPVFISSNLNPQEELLNHLSISKASSDLMKGSRIKSRLLGLVSAIELDNNKYSR